MSIGVIFPQTEYGIDPEAIRDSSQTAESLGYTHILAYELVLATNPHRTGGWIGPYTYQHAFFEPFALFSFMAVYTITIEFTTGINPLPIQCPIPFWIGGHPEAVLRRIVRIRDGWMLNYCSPQDAQIPLQIQKRYLEDAGRARCDIGLESRLHYGNGYPSKWDSTLTGWHE